MVFSHSADMRAQVRLAMQFCAAESCGKCTPCRISGVRRVELVDRLGALLQIYKAPKSARSREEDIALREDLCETMRYGALSALGGFTPDPVLCALRNCREKFE